MVLLIVLVTLSAVVTVLGFTPHHSYYCHGLLYGRSLVDGVLYLTCLLLFGLMMSAWHHQHCYMMWTGVILIASDSALSLLLSSNNSNSSFYWTRGSKICFLISFSYFSCYFLILEFLQNCYLLFSSRLSWLHKNPISCPYFLYLCTQRYSIIHAPPHF